jgi:single-strand DNA-binding protein
VRLLQSDKEAYRGEKLVRIEYRIRREKNMQNILALTGRLTSDIEIKTFDSGDRSASFSLAVQRNFKNKSGEYDTDFIPCKAWNGTADILQKYFKKGSVAPVTGELRQDKYVDKDGNNRSFMYVNVNSVTFVESSGKKDDTVTYGEGDAFPEFSAPSEDDEVPF